MAHAGYDQGRFMQGLFNAQNSNTMQSQQLLDVHQALGIQQASAAHQQAFHQTSPSEHHPLKQEIDMFSSSKWTGGNDLPKIAALDLMERVKPALHSSKEPLAYEKPRVSQEEYAAIAKSIGFAHPHIESDFAVEDFKAFLRKKDWAVFNLPAVISYMDKKAEAESAAKSGWHWRPLREKDHLKNAKFGVRAANYGGTITPASDYYESGGRRQDRWGQISDEPASGSPYDKLVPIHALKKVAAIESEYKKPVAFYVCDYAPAPKIENPDPFLMAVINNPRLKDGVGRFVIDFWDEPGFGLTEQLK